MILVSVSLKNFNIGHNSRALAAAQWARCVFNLAFLYTETLEIWSILKSKMSITTDKEDQSIFTELPHLEVYFSP